HGWTSLIGAIMRHSDPAGRYQTMPDRPLSTLARATAHTESSRGRGAVLEWTSKVTEARPTHAPPRDLRREARLAARGRPRAVRPTGARDRAPEPGRPLRRTEANGPRVAGARGPDLSHRRGRGPAGRRPQRVEPVEPA